MSISDKIRLWSINAWHSPDKEDKVRRLRMRYVWLKEWVIQCNFTAQNLIPFPISAVVVGSQTFSYWRLKRRMNGLLNLGTNFTSLNLSGRHLSSTLSDHPRTGIPCILPAYRPDQNNHLLRYRSAFCVTVPIFCE